MDDETHHKVDPKEERIRRVEARAASEPFGAKRHPANNEKKKGRRSTLPVINASTITIQYPGFCHSALLPAKQKRRGGERARTRHRAQLC